MHTQFAHDLRVARRKTGFTQKDIAHLLEAQSSLLSTLEGGTRRPTLEQIIDLSLIYGRSFESLFGVLLDERRLHLRAALERLPEQAQPTAETYNRAASIKRLKRRLNEPASYGGA